MSPEMIITDTVPASEALRRERETIAAQLAAGAALLNVATRPSATRPSSKRGRPLKATDDEIRAAVDAAGGDKRAAAAALGLCLATVRNRLERVRVRALLAGARQ